MNGQSTRGKSEKQNLVCCIHQEHHEVLYFYAMGLCRRFGYDPSYADDLMQEFYYRVMYRYETFATKYAQYGLPYLYRCLKHYLIDLTRKKKSINRLEVIFTQQLPEVGNLYNLCTDAYTEQFYEMLQEILPDRYFPPMKAYVDGFSYQEISELFGIPVNTVGVYIHRAKKILKNALK